MFCSCVFLEYCGINNDIHYYQAITQCKFLHYKTFHGHKCLMLSRPDPLPFTERVWLRQTNNLP